MDGRAIEACLNLGALLDCAARDLREQVEERTRTAGLNETSFRLLWQVQRAPNAEGISQIELARELHISTAQTSALVETIRKRRWLKAHRPANDRRRQLWQLTPKGETLLASLMPELGQWARQLQSENGNNLSHIKTLLGQLIRPSEDDQESTPHILPTPAAASARSEQRGAA